MRMEAARTKGEAEKWAVLEPRVQRTDGNPSVYAFRVFISTVGNFSFLIERLQCQYDKIQSNPILSHVCLIACDSGKCMNTISSF